MSQVNHHQFKTLRLRGHNNEDRALAVDLLKQGSLVALPTETVYGLAGNGLCAQTIRNIFTAKNRPLHNPLILHVATVSQAIELFDLSTNPQALSRFHKLAQAFWPGPLTIIAKKARHLPHEATAHLETVAVRIPNNETCLAVLNHLPFPLVMPSANLSTRPSPTEANHVLHTLDGKISAVVDDGPCVFGIESTVIKIDGPTPIILRPGILNKQQIRQCLNEDLGDFCASSTEIISPGQTKLHYSPAISSVQLCIKDDAMKHWSSTSRLLARRSDFAELAKKMGTRSSSFTDFLLSDEPAAYAHELYRALYESEHQSSCSLVIILPPNTDDFYAINDRLSRMARASVEMIEGAGLQNRQ